MLQTPAAWSEVTGPLRAMGHRVVAPMLPGHGEAPWGLELDSFDAVTEALGRAIAREAPNVDVLCGYSFGARLALSLAGDLRLGIQHTVAIGPHPGLRDVTARLERQAWEEDLAQLAERDGLDALLARWETFPVFTTQRPEQVEQQRVMRTAHTARGIAWAMRTLGTGRMPDLRERIRVRASAATLITGALDAKFAPLARALAEEMPVRHLEVPGVGHNVVLGAPDAICAAIGAALEATIGPRESPPRPSLEIT
jgi:2-succinyl-6-hydroxy-2,4-cyclohexadiene-1-carboxylate synthase